MAYKQKGFQSGNGKTHGKMTGDPVPSDSTQTSTPVITTTSGTTVIGGQRVSTVRKTRLHELGYLRLPQASTTQNLK